MASKKAMIGGGVVALLIIGGTAGAVLKHNAEDSDAPTSPYVRAGGYLCDQSGYVMGQRQLRNNGVNMAFRGCTQIGADLYVNVLYRDPTFGSVQVGNSGGTAWVDSDDLVR